MRPDLPAKCSLACLLVGLCFCTTGCISWHESREVVGRFEGAPEVKVQETEAHFSLDAKQDGASITVAATKTGQCAEVTRVPVTTNYAIRHTRDSGGVVMTVLGGLAAMAVGTGLMVGYSDDPCGRGQQCRPLVGGIVIGTGLISMLALAGKPGSRNADRFESAVSWREAHTQPFACHEGPAADVLLTMRLPDGTTARALTDEKGFARLALPPGEIAEGATAVIAMRVNPAVEVRVELVQPPSRP